MKGARTAALCLLLLALTTAARALPDFAPLVERYGKAVVNISTQQRLPRLPPPGRTGEEGEDRAQRDSDPLFDDILCRAFRDRPEYEEETSLGSGVIISADGYILTCAHVVEEVRARSSCG